MGKEVVGGVERGGTFPFTVYYRFNRVPGAFLYGYADQPLVASCDVTVAVRRGSDGGDRRTRVPGARVLFTIGCGVQK